MSTAATLFLALGLPLLVVLAFTVLLLRHPDRLPPLLQRFTRREAMLWNIGIGLLIALSALRYLLTR
jgi:hypothetical protein